MARHHAAEGRQRVERQRRILAELRADRHPTAMMEQEPERSIAATRALRRRKGGNVDRARTSTAPIAPSILTLVNQKLNHGTDPCTPCSENAATWIDAAA